MSTSDTNNNDLGITMEKMSLDVLPYSTSFIQEQFDELHKVKSKQQKVPLLIWTHLNLNDDFEHVPPVRS